MGLVEKPCLSRTVGERIRGPACAQQGALKSISGDPGSSADGFETGEPMVETSLKPTKKGSLAGIAKEPFEIAPLGFEPRLIESESIVLPLH